MTLRRGFKQEANEYAREFREELHLRPYEPLSPWDLAQHLEIDVLSLSSLRQTVSESVYHLMQVDRSSFSAAAVFCGS